MVDDRYVASSQQGWRQRLGLAPDQPIPRDYVRRALGMGPAPPPQPPQAPLVPSVGAANRADEPWRAGPAAGAFTSPIRRSGPGAPQVMPQQAPQVMPQQVPQVPPPAPTPAAPGNVTQALSRDVYSPVPGVGAPSILSLSPSFSSATPVGPTPTPALAPQAVAAATPPAPRFNPNSIPEFTQGAGGQLPPAGDPRLGAQPLGNPLLGNPSPSTPMLTSGAPYVAPGTPPQRPQPPMDPTAPSGPGAVAPAAPASGERVLAGGQQDPRFTPYPTVQAPMPPSRPAGFGVAPIPPSRPPGLGAQAPTGPIAHVQGPDFLRRFFLAGQPPPTGMSAMIAPTDRLEGDRGGNR